MDPRNESDEFVPGAPHRPEEFRHHGMTRVDPFFGLRCDDRSDPAVIEYLEEENRFCRRWFERHGINGLSQEIYHEMSRFIPGIDESVPARDGDYLYWTRMTRDMDHPVILRKPVPVNGGQASENVQVVLDADQFSKSFDYFQLVEWEVSPDGRMLAFSIDPDGSECPQLWFRSLNESESAAGFRRTSLEVDEICWARDSRHLFLTTHDDQWRSDRVWVVDTHESELSPMLVFKETDPAFWVQIASSQDGQSLLISSGSSTTSEVHAVSMMDPSWQPVCIHRRSPGVEYDCDIDHDQGLVWMRTNAFRPDFSLIEFKLGQSPDPDSTGTRMIGLPSEQVRIDGFQLFRRHVILFLREAGQESLAILNRKTGSLVPVPLPDGLWAIEEGDNNLWDPRAWRFSLSGIDTPGAVMEVHNESGEVTILKQIPVPADFDPSHYRVWREEVPVRDKRSEVSIPVTLAMRTDPGGDGPRPGVVHVYGAYGDILEPYFRSSFTALMDCGFVVALAHVRGGGFLGESWRLAARMNTRPVAVDDFVAVAEWLQEKGPVSKGSLGVSAASAGGVVAGAALNRCPGLFGAAVLEVPFVDIVSTMSDPDIPLTLAEYEEWGNPQDPLILREMLAYSPYDNIRRQTYPPILVTAGLNDPRVGYWEPAKYVARLRLETPTVPETLFLRTAMDGGHFGSSGRDQQIREVAEQCAFLVHFLQTP